MKKLQNRIEGFSEIEQGATVIVTHRVRKGMESEYEKWLSEIAPVSQSQPGHLDWQVVRPIPGLTTTYTIIIRFDTHDNLHRWITSKDRQMFIDRVTPILCKGDDVLVKSGLDFWFTPEGAKAKLPTRWKQALLTWSALFPLGAATNFLLSPIIDPIAIFDNHYLRTLFTSAIVILLMVYVVMPRYTKLVQHWLFK